MIEINYLIKKFKIILIIFIPIILVSFIWNNFKSKNILEEPTKSISIPIYKSTEPEFGEQEFIEQESTEPEFGKQEFIEQESTEPESTEPEFE